MIGVIVSMADKVLMGPLRLLASSLEHPQQMHRASALKTCIVLSDSMPDDADFTQVDDEHARDTFDVLYILYPLDKSSSFSTSPT